MIIERLLMLVLVLAGAVIACSSAQPPTGSAESAETLTPLPGALTAGGVVDMETALPRLADKRVVFIGENHDRYDHHLNQLGIIQRLHRAGGGWTIGLEMFQQPSQRYLDAYIAGQIDELELLRRTDYFKHWGFDYRLYRPILRFAREQGIPLLALNVPSEISRKVGDVGIAGLSVMERTWVPDIDKSDAAYRERLQGVFEQHQGIAPGAFESFMEVQLLWDEAMAEQAARYLRANPERRLVVLAGNGHLNYGAGIPNRLQRRLTAPAVIILQGDPNSTDRQGADYLLLSKPVELPPAGRLGLMLDASASGPGVHVQNLLPNGTGGKAGIRAEDRLLEIDGRPIQSMHDVRTTLLDRSPGEIVQIKVGRGRKKAAQTLVLPVTLQ